MQNKQVSEKVLITGIVVSMFLWGLSWPSGKVLTAYSSAINFVVYRYIFVVGTLFPILLFLRTGIQVKKQGIPIIIGSGILLGLYSFLFFKGLKNGHPGAGGVLVTTLNPIMAYSIGIFLSKKMPSRNESIGLVLGLIAGCVLLEVWNHPDAILASGNVYFLLAAFTWAVMSKLTSKAGLYGSSLSFSLWQYIITLCFLLPMMDVQEFKLAIHITDHLFWINLIFSSAIVTTLATTVYFYATTRLGPEKASSYIFMVPLAAAVSSWLFLDEHILPHTIVGGMLGMAAVYIINKEKKTN
ncbi:MAG: DMT family transporter [Bacteroidetes bacterium]|nr:DMT family transporter [Bacteroidota bacterium]